jgi:hypothetical protein
MQSISSSMRKGAKVHSMTSFPLIFRNCLGTVDPKRLPVPPAGIRTCIFKVGALKMGALKIVPQRQESQ